MILSGREPRINSPGEITGMEPMLHQDKNIVAMSIVRGDNHFIRIRGKWILIDGSWFDWLDEHVYPGSTMIRIAQFTTSNLAVCDSLTLNNLIPYDELVWYRIAWYRHYTEEGFDFGCNWPGSKNWSSDWKPGWICKDGILPCHLESVEYQEWLLDLGSIDENNSRDRIRRAGLHRR